MFDHPDLLYFELVELVFVLLELLQCFLVLFCVGLEVELEFVADVGELSDLLSFRLEFSLQLYRLLLYGTELLL